MINERDPILFPSSWQHNIIADRFRSRDFEITSAAFVDIHRGVDGELVVNAHGESASLKLKSKDIDSLIIKSLLIFDEY